MLLWALLGLIWIGGCVSVHKEECKGLNERMNRMDQRISGLEDSQALESRIDHLEKRMADLEKHLAEDNSRGQTP